MRIGVFTDNFYPSVGGLEASIDALSRAYINLGHEVVVCCPKTKLPADDSTFPYRVIRARALKVAENDYFAFPRMDSNFKKQLKNEKFDLIHVHAVYPMSSYGIRLAKKTKTPLLCTCHTILREAYYSAIKIRFLSRWIPSILGRKLRNATALTCVGANIVDEVRSYGYKGIIHVQKNGNNPVTANTSKALRDKFNHEQGLSDDEFVMHFMGRLVKYKGVQMIVDAIEQLKEQGIKTTCFFVGKGSDLELFRKQVKDKGLERYARFLGYVAEGEELDKLFSRSDLFVFPSYFDTDGLVVVEAAFCDIPSLVLKGTGPSERITDAVNGYICDNSTEAFAAKIKEIYLNPKKRKEIGKNAHAQLPNSWEDVAQKYIDYVFNPKQA